MNYIHVVLIKQKLQKKNGLVFGMNKHAGFTLLELLIVILIMGLLGAVIMPNLKRTTPRYEREEFIARFNALTQLAWRQALGTHNAQQVSIDLSKKIIFLLADTGQKDRSGEPVFKPITDLAQDTSLSIPDQFEFKQFF